MIGVLGMGKRSTAYLIDQLKDSAHVLVQSDFDQINAYLPNGYDQFKLLLKSDILQVIDQGGTHIVIPNITMNDHVDKVIQEYDLPITLIHPYDEVIRLMKKNGQSTAIIFGSRFTMQSEGIARRFADQGINLKRPLDMDIQMVDEYRRRIYSYTESPVDDALYLERLQDYASRMPVILACSELSIPEVGEGSDQVYDLLDLVLAGI